MNQAELAAEIGVTARHLRYLVAERIVGPATASGRGADGYDATHLEDWRRYRAAVEASPGGRLSAAEARAALGFPHGTPGGVASEVDLGPFRAVAREGADLSDEAISAALDGAGEWLRRLRADRDGGGR